MDEASSRFVDRIALERLVTEKLQTVQHRPTAPLELMAQQPFADLLNTPPIGETRPADSPNTILLRSVPNPLDPEQDWCPLLSLPCDTPKGTILFVHGLYEDNRRIHDFLINELRRLGYGVCVTTLPYHYERTPASSKFSGEFFFSANLQRSKGAFCRACNELRQAYEWVSANAPGPAYVVGFSMGGTVALGLATRCAALKGLFIINPAACLPDVVWTSPLCQSIRRDLSDAGCDERSVDRALVSFDPFFFKDPAMPLARIQMTYSIYDEVTSVAQYQALAAQWQFANVRTYKAGHMNILRVPRVAEDIVKFFDSLSSSHVTRQAGAAP